MPKALSPLLERERDFDPAPLLLSWEKGYSPKGIQERGMRVVRNGNVKSCQVNREHNPINRPSSATSYAKISEARSSQAFMTYLPADNSFPEKLRRWSQEPFWWAAIASLGVHSLLWVVLPFLPSSEKTEQEIQKPVALIQLTPQEQSRLPDFAAPQAITPTFPTPPNGGFAGGLPGQGFSLSPLPNQGFGRLPSSTLPPFFVPSFPPPSFRSRTASRFPQRSPFVIPPPPPSTLPPVTPATPPSPVIPDLSPEFTTSGRILNLPSPDPDAPPLFAKPPSATPSSPATPNGEAGTPSPTTSGTPAPSGTSSPSGQPLSPEQQLAELRRQRPRLFTFNPQETSSDQANLAYIGWLNQIGRQEQDPDTLEKVELSSTYPPAACLLAPELDNKAVTSVVGVLVDADDTLVGDPVPLSTGGYGIFAVTAIAIAREHAFDNTTDAAQPYLVQVTFTYNRDACTPAP